MNKKFFLVLGIGVIALGYMFNLGYAADDYGMVKNSLSLSIIAQSGSSGDGSGSGSGGGSGGGESGEGEEEDDIEISCSSKISVEIHGHLDSEERFVFVYLVAEMSCDTTSGEEKTCMQGTLFSDEDELAYENDDWYETIQCPSPED